MSNFNRVFMVTADANHYAILQETDLELSIQKTNYEFPNMHGNSLSDYWVPIEVDWLIVEGESSLTIPDIAAWGSVALATPEKLAMNLVGLKDSCEFLPLNLKGERWTTFNITNVIDAIDKNKTEFNFRNGKPSRIRPFKNLVLNKDAISNGGLFRVQGAGLRTFCTDQVGGLYERVNSLKLTGLNFKEVSLT